MMKINELRYEVYQIAVAHGWHDEDKPDAHWLALIMCEVAEVVEADRVGKRADKAQYLQDIRYAFQNKAMTAEAFMSYKRDLFCLYIKDSIEDELADICIRVLDLAGLRRIVIKGNMPDVPLLEDRIRKQTITEWAYHITRLITKGDMDTAPKLSLILSYVFILADKMGIDIEFHIKEKVKYNRGREYKHGKRY